MKSFSLVSIFLLLILLIVSSQCRRRHRQRESRGKSAKQRSSSTSSPEEDFYPSNNPSPGCPTCHCTETPTCPPGVSLLEDGCGCCKICARQLKDECNVTNVCDKHKRLFCNETIQTCQAKPGRSCNVQGTWYSNGELFRPSCRAACSCIDGDLGCVPTCTTPRSSPASLQCTHPKLIRRKGGCCGEWVCLRNGKLESDMLPFENQVKGHKKSHVTFRKGDGCMVQTTPWSECSKTCGFGISDRVTNDNSDCKLKKEMRLCNLRPCNYPVKSKKKRKRCKKNLRHNKRVQFSLSGCLSAEIYRPKYCGVCPGKCCDPKSEKTVTVKFLCKNEANVTSSFTRDMMLIKKCHCHQCPHDNNIFSSAYTGLGGDTSRLT